MGGAVDEPEHRFDGCGIREVRRSGSAAAEFP